MNCRSLKFIVFISLVGTLSTWFQPASAQGILEHYQGMIKDHQVQPFITHALKNINPDACDDRNMCRSATEDELSNPPISVEVGRAAMAHGIVSALANWCGLDFRRSFMPMVAYGKHQAKLNERQMMLLVTIHGTFSSQQLKVYKSQGECPGTFKAQLDKQLPNLPR